MPRGEPGEVVVRGYHVMQGYFEDEEETRKTIDAEGWLHTGDVAVMDERGYLRITDRIKDMFITGGFNCYPAEIENLLYGHGGIAQAAVIGIPDERLGEVGKAFVVPAPGRGAHARGGDRLVPRADGQLQGAARRRDRGRAADQRLGQGDEVRAAGAASSLTRSPAARARGLPRLRVGSFAAPALRRRRASPVAPGAQPREREVDDRVDQSRAELSAAEEQPHRDRADDQVDRELEVEIARQLAALDRAFEHAHQRASPLAQHRVEELRERLVVAALAGQARQHGAERRRVEELEVVRAASASGRDTRSPVSTSSSAGSRLKASTTSGSFERQRR